MVVLTFDTRSGYCAFTHKAGIHAKAILNNPSTYEILKPEDFGLTRYVSIGYVTVLFLRTGLPGFDWTYIVPSFISSFVLYCASNNITIGIV